MAKMIVGSEGTLGVVLDAKLNLVPLPKAKAVMAIEFADLLEALEATPADSEHTPSAVEIMDKVHPRSTRGRMPRSTRSDAKFIAGDPAATVVRRVLRRSRKEDLPPRLEALEHDLRAQAFGYSLSTTQSSFPNRRESGVCAKRRSASRWR